MTRRQTHNVTLERPPIQSGDFVRGSIEWERVADLYVEIKPLRGQELVNAQQVDDTVTHRVRTHWMSGVTADMRLNETETGRIFHIRGRPLNVNEANRWLEMLCVESD